MDRLKESEKKVFEIYPDGIGAQIVKFLSKQDGIASVHLSQFHDEQQGLTDDILNNTDVMVWWGHLASEEVTDENANRVYQRVMDGMGFIPLHSALVSRVFMKLMGTGCMVKWREIGERERLWVVDPGHPIVDGLPEYFELEETEMYGEHFDIPQPDRLIFISWFQGGEVMRSGCCWHRGRGKVFFFRPGHETLPIYYNENVVKVISNAVKWAAPCGVKEILRGNVQPLEDVPKKG